jgi:hypothetical protein
LLASIIFLSIHARSLGLPNPILLSSLKRSMGAVVDNHPLSSSFHADNAIRPPRNPMEPYEDITELPALAMMGQASSYPPPFVVASAADIGVAATATSGTCTSTQVGGAPPHHHPLPLAAAAASAIHPHQHRLHYHHLLGDHISLSPSAATAAANAANAANAASAASAANAAVSSFNTAAPSITYHPP